MFVYHNALWLLCFSQCLKDLPDEDCGRIVIIRAQFAKFWVGLSVIVNTSWKSTERYSDRVVQYAHFITCAVFGGQLTNTCTLRCY